MEWINVKKRLPDKDGEYLCYTKSPYGNWMVIYNFALNLEKVDDYDFRGRKYCGWYEYDGEWGYGEIDNVTHWMPLPEKPVN